MTLFETARQATRADPDKAVELLERDRAWAAYPLCYLDPASGTTVDTWVPWRDRPAAGLVTVVQLSRLTSIFALGDAQSVALALGGVRDLPTSGVFSARAAGLEGLSTRLRVSTSYPMTRMRVTGATLHAKQSHDVTRLGIGDIDAVKRLYGVWTDVNQLPGQLSRGVYFGVWSGGALISVAGTHCVSALHRVAAIGNVLTHAEHRNTGLASSTTSAVAEELFRLGCDEVVLNVRLGNDAARAAYNRLGFEAYCDFVEGIFSATPG